MAQCIAIERAASFYPFEHIRHMWGDMEDDQTDSASPVTELLPAPVVVKKKVKKKSAAPP